MENILSDLITAGFVVIVLVGVLLFGLGILIGIWIA